MNTVQFLISLKDTRENINFGSSDLETLIDNFKPKVFDDYFKDYPIKGKHFLKTLEEDIRKASPQEIKILATFMQDKFVSRYDNGQEKPLLKVLNKELKEYIIRNYDQFNILHYAKFLISAEKENLEKDLNSKINLSFSNEKNNVIASAQPFDKSHLVDFNKFPSPLSHPTKQLFEMFMSLYHEQYHLLVYELANNPNCYKIDILKYSIFNQIRQTANNNEATNKLYDFYYLDLKEEMNANLYGIKRAKQELLKINPDFRVYSAKPNLEKNFYKAATLNNTDGYSTRSQEDEFEAILDNVFLKDKNSNTEVYEIIKKIYNEDGTRKDFYTLKSDFKKALHDDKEKQSLDICNFYYYAIYRYLKKMDLTTFQTFIANLTEEEIELVEQSLMNNITRLNNDLINLNNAHLYYLTSNVKKYLTKKIIQKELNQINERQNTLIYTNQRERENTHGKN